MHVVMRKHNSNRSFKTVLGLFITSSNKVLYKLLNRDNNLSQINGSYKATRAYCHDVRKLFTQISG